MSRRTVDRHSIDASYGSNRNTPGASLNRQQDVPHPPPDTTDCSTLARMSPSDTKPAYKTCTFLFQFIIHTSIPDHHLKYPHTLLHPGSSHSMIGSLYIVYTLNNPDVKIIHQIYITISRTLLLILRGLAEELEGLQKSADPFEETYKTILIPLWGGELGAQ